MARYRRKYIAGGRYFFTVNLARRSDTILVDHIDLLRQAYMDTVRDMPLTCDAMVVLPDHLHAVWTLPAHDSDFSERWRLIKFRFSRALGQTRARSASKHAKRECGIWQRRFWEHAIWDEADYMAHMRYCWFNPVKHGFVRRAADWPYSSLHRDIRAGRVAADWVGDFDEGDFGER
ncbi:MAG: transposase [Pseudomonadota bacterium]